MSTEPGLRKILRDRLIRWRKFSYDGVHRGATTIPCRGTNSSDPLSSKRDSSLARVSASDFSFRRVVDGGAQGVAGLREPMVRIHFPPAESPCLTQTRPLQVENRGFRAGVRRLVGGAVGGDAQGGAISHQRTAISLLAPIPVPPCCRHGLGCLGTCRFRLGIERGSGSRKAEHGPLLMPGGKRWRR
jgi:hypothetical protein